MRASRKGLSKTLSASCLVRLAVAASLVTTLSPEGLVRFVTGRGATIHKIGIGEFAGSDDNSTRRGLLALEDVSAGDILMVAPWGALLTVQHVKNDTGNAMSALARDAHALRLGQADVLALFLLREYFEQNGSEWAPYMCMLPRAFTTPLFWPDKNIEAMHNEKIKSIAIEQKQLIATRFHRVILPALQRHPTLFRPGLVTQTAYAWAMTNVATRNWVFPFHDDNTLFMVPFAELANHENNNRGGALLIKKGTYIDKPSGAGRGWVRRSGNWTAQNNDEGGEYEMLLIAGRNYSKGDEVFISYGDDCDQHFILNYGFDPGNALPCTEALSSVLSNMDINSPAAEPPQSIKY